MKRYITGFNGLRTIGVLAVILYHLYPTVLKGGFLGVVLFFVLSAYLATDSMLRVFDETQKIQFWSFWKKRIKRLYPMMITVFIVTTPFLLVLNRAQLAGLRSNFLSSIFLVQNWWQIQQGASYFANAAGESPFKHIYYLAIEGQFFLILPLLMFFFMKIIRSKKHSFYILSILTLISVIAMMVLYHPGQDPTRVYYGTDTRIFSLLMGMSLAFIMPMSKMKDNMNKNGRKFFRNVFIGVSVLFLLSLIFMDAQSSLTYYGGLWFASLLSMFLVGLVAHPSLSANKILSNPVFDYIGSRSYGIYLWQMPVFAIAGNTMVNALSWYNVIWQIVLILGLSELSYRFVENPLGKFDYSRPISKLRAYFTVNGKTLKAVPVYAIIVFVLFSGTTIFASPASPHDAKILEANILAQQKALQEKQRATANANASVSSKDIAKQFGVEPIVAEKAGQMKIYAIGDSVMVAGSTDLQQAFPKMTIDAAVGRQTSDGANILQSNPDKVAQSDAILIGLGTNGLIEDSDISEVMKAANGKPVYWINVHVPTRPWQNQDNELLKNAAKKYKNLTIIDWYNDSQNHTDWFYSDNIHPYGEGATQYTKLIMTNLTKKALQQ